MFNEQLACSDLFAEQGSNDFCYFDKVRANAMAELGLAEVSPTMVHGDSIATRITDKGREIANSVSGFGTSSLFAQQPLAAAEPDPVEEQLEPTNDEVAPINEEYLIKHLPATYSAVAKKIGVAPEAAKKGLDALVKVGKVVKQSKTYKLADQVAVVEPEADEVEADKNAPAIVITSQVLDDEASDRGSTQTVVYSDESPKQAAFEFDRDIPIPPGPSRNRASKLPNLEAMEVGDSFWLSVEGSTAKNPAGSISSQISNRCKRDGIKYQFTVRKVDASDPRGPGVRVWRKA